MHVFFFSQRKLPSHGKTIKWVVKSNLGQKHFLESKLRHSKRCSKHSLYHCAFKYKTFRQRSVKYRALHNTSVWSTSLPFNTLLHMTSQFLHMARHCYTKQADHSSISIFNVWKDAQDRRKMMNPTSSPLQLAHSLVINQSKKWTLVPVRQSDDAP